MNKARRKALQKIVDKLNEIQTEELEAYENLPESIYSSPRGDDMEENGGDLEEAIETIEEVINR